MRKTKTRLKETETTSSSSQDMLSLLQQRFLDLEQISSTGIWEIEIASGKTTWSDECFRIWNVTPREFSPSRDNTLLLIHPDDRKIYSQLYDQNLVESTSLSAQIRVMSSDHEVRYLQLIWKKRSDLEGNPQKLVGIVNDVTDKVKHLLQETKSKELSLMISSSFNNDWDLKTSLDQLLIAMCSYFDQLGCEVWITDMDETNIWLMNHYAEGKVLHVDSRTMPLLNGEGLPGRSWKTGTPVYIKDVRKSSVFHRKQFAETNQLTSSTALPVTTHDRTIAVLLFFGKTEEAGPVNIHKSILTELAFQIQRKKSDEQFRRFFSYSPELLCIAGPDGYFRKVNPAFIQLLGYKEEELLARPCTDFIHPLDLGNTNATLKDISRGRVIYSFENRYRTKSNEWIWISWTTSEVFNEEGLVFCYGKDITEEKKLRDLFNSTAQLANIGSWEVDLINKKTYWSSVTYHIHEVDDDIDPDTELAISFYKEGVNRETIERLVEEGITKGNKWDAELMIVTAKGTEKWVRVIGEPEMFNGQCVRIYGSIQDINSRKTAQLETLRLLEERNNILESLGEGFFTLDRNWMVAYWNRQAELLTGKSRDEMLGQNFWTIFPDQVNSPFYDHCQKGLFHKQEQYFNIFYEPLQVWYSVSLYPTTNGISIYFKDVSDRVLANEKAKQSNERFELVAKATNDAIWDFDLQTNVFTYIGDSFKQLFGYSNEELGTDARFILELIHPDDLEEITSSRTMAIADASQLYWEDEYRFKTKNGNYAFIHDRGYIIRDDQGKALRMIGATQDVTHRKEYEQSLEKLNADLEKYAKDLAASNAELEQFAYVASHDLQEPLRMVSSFMSLLEKNYGDKVDEQGKQYIHFAVDGARRMRQIILDLLEYSRVKRFSQQKEDVNLKEIVDEVLLFNLNQINDKQATIRVGDLPKIMSYRVPLRQVIQNLVGNALKYVKPGEPPFISIQCHEVGDAYQFEVTDHGIGIAPEYFEKIFILFQRLNNRNDYSGTGIGLSVCKKIVENLGGKIWVVSEEGKGSSFLFTIPKDPS